MGQIEHHIEEWTLKAEFVKLKEEFRIRQRQLERVVVDVNQAEEDC